MVPPDQRRHHQKRKYNHPHPRPPSTPTLVRLPTTLPDDTAGESFLLLRYRPKFPSDPPSANHLLHIPANNTSASDPGDLPHHRTRRRDHPDRRQRYLHHPLLPFRISFNRQTGWLVHYEIKGTDLLDDTLGLKSNFCRPAITIQQVMPPIPVGSPPRANLTCNFSQYYQSRTDYHPNRIYLAAPPPPSSISAISSTRAARCLSPNKSNPILPNHQPANGHCPASACSGSFPPATTRSPPMARSDFHPDRHLPRPSGTPPQAAYQHNRDPHPISAGGRSPIRRAMASSSSPTPRCSTKAPSTSCYDSNRPHRPNHTIPPATDPTSTTTPTTPQHRPRTRIHGKSPIHL